MSESVDEKMGNTHSLTNSSTHLLKDKIAVETIEKFQQARRNFLGVEGR